MKFVRQLFLLWICGCFAVSRADGTYKWVSPDHLHYAETKMEMVHQQEDLSWDVVRALDKAGVIRATLSLENTQGLIDEGAWSKDSRFFVFSSSSSGGHSPWHTPSYVYDANTSLIFSIDDSLGAVTKSKIILTDRDAVKLNFWNFKGDQPDHFVKTIDLRQFVQTEGKIALNSIRR